MEGIQTGSYMHTMVHTWFTAVLQVACSLLTRRLFLLSIDWNDCLRTPQEIVAAWQEAIDRLLERGVTGRILLGNLAAGADDVSEFGLKHARSQSTVVGTCIVRDRATAEGLHFSAQICVTYGDPRPLHQPLHQPIASTIPSTIPSTIASTILPTMAAEAILVPNTFGLDAYFSTSYVLVRCVGHGIV